MTAWRLLGGQVALVALRTMMADGSGGPDDHGGPGGPGGSGGPSGPKSPNLPDSIYEKCRIRTVYSV